MRDNDPRHIAKPASAHPMSRERGDMLSEIRSLRDRREQARSLREVAELTTLLDEAYSELGRTPDHSDSHRLVRERNYGWGAL